MQDWPAPEDLEDPAAIESEDELDPGDMEGDGEEGKAAGMGVNFFHLRACIRAFIHLYGCVLVCACVCATHVRTLLLLRQ
jgi:hypothetical protein